MNKNELGKAAEAFAYKVAEANGWVCEFKSVRTAKMVGRGKWISHRVDYASLWDRVYWSEEEQLRRFVQVKTSESEFSRFKNSPELAKWLEVRHGPATQFNRYEIWLVGKEARSNRWTLFRSLEFLPAQL